MITVSEGLDRMSLRESTESSLFDTSIKQAAFNAYLFFCRPLGARTASYQQRFDRKIDSAHIQEPLVSRALLARFAIHSIIHSDNAMFQQPEVDQAEALLSEEFIDFKLVAEMRQHPESTTTNPD